MRYALIKAGKTENVIEAEAAFFDAVGPEWTGRYDEIVALDDKNEAGCEPGSTYDGRDFARAAPVVAPLDPVAQKLAAIEARLAAVEDAKAVR